MSDTQWPRYFVFKQDSVDKPHLNCGTIHAPDAEMALFNARDVFVRRPECVSLWVVPAEEVLARTREEMERGSPTAPSEDEGPGEPFAVFLKRDHRGQHSYAGELVAGDAEEALARAWGEHGDSGATAFWVVPVGAIGRSESADNSAWFGPARDKPYRHGSFYQTNTLMRKLVSGRSLEDEGRSDD